MPVHYTEREEKITRRVGSGFAGIALVAVWLFFSNHTISEKRLFETYGQGYSNSKEFTENPSYRVASSSCFILRCKTRIIFENRNSVWKKPGELVLADIYYWRWGHIYKVMYA